MVMGEPATFVGRGGHMSLPIAIELKAEDAGDPFAVVLPARAPDKGRVRFGVAFGLSLGIHALFFLLLLVAMGETRGPVATKPVEFVLVDFSLSGDAAPSREAA